ncbi:MAG: DUF885 domain-containing protein, partial [Myxococcota bacterium]
IVAATPFRNIEDYDKYILRIEQVGRLADEVISLLRRGIETGFVHPCDSLRGTADAVDQLVPADIESSFAYRPVRNMPDGLKGEAPRIQKRVKMAIESSVIPGYRRYADFIRTEYLPACRQTYGLSAIEGGAAAYDALVKYYSTLPDTTPDSVHALGLSEVARIRTDMQAIMQEVKFEGDLSAFFEYMRTHSGFYVSRKEDFLARISVISKEIDRMLPRFFAHIPRNRFALTPIPEASAPKGPIAYYMPGSFKDGVAGQYYVNLYDLSSKSLNGLPALSLHEAEPGHHFQISIQQELGELPKFRRFYYISAYGEGWGLYAEYLGREMGIYKTPYERFAQLSFEMWRACRLVVDTGIHAKGWTRQRAIDFMAQNSSLSLANITNEIDRYITFPGQAISYKIGELKIKSLRAAAEARLGARFSLRDFHAHLLRAGAVPLPVLERRMMAWIEAEVSKNP